MFGNFSMMEMAVVLGLAVLLFGKRLPEVGRSLGKGIVEFKKSLRGFEQEFRFDEHSFTGGTTGHNSYNSYKPEPNYSSSDLVESTVPKFEPPTAAPVRKPDEVPTTPIPTTPA